jgi:hypothetical protein
MTNLELALNNPATVRDETTFSETTYHIISEIGKAEGTASLLLSIKLEELKCHYYTNKAMSLGFHWREIANTYLESAHHAFDHLMELYKQLPEVE